MILALPDPPQNCRFLRNSSSLLEIACLSGFNGGLRTSYILEVMSSNAEEDFIKITKETPHFTLDKIRRNEDYYFNLYAENIKGRSKIVQLDYELMEPSTPMPPRNGQFTYSLI